MLRSLLGNATLSVLARNTPVPVATYDLPPIGGEISRTPPFTARVNGIEIAYDAFGDPQDPPLLLIMGLGGQMVAWDDDFCTRLAARGFRVIRFDNRDIGRSTWLDDEPVPNILALRRALRRGELVRVPYLLADMAADALGLLDVLDLDSAHVVGISMGGMIGQTMAIAAPERVRTLTSMMSHTGETDLPGPNWRAALALFMPSPRRREGFIRRTILVWRVLHGPRMAVDLARIQRQAERAYERGIHPVGVVRQLAAILASGSRAEGLRTLRVRTLVVHGNEDPLVPLAAGERTAALVPGAELDLVDGLGHALPPPVWDLLIDRIARHARS